MGILNPGVGNFGTVTITGGSIDNTTIGATTPSTGAFTWLSTNSSTSSTPVLSFDGSNTALAQAASVPGSYLQNILQNRSGGVAGSSTNYVASNNIGTDSSYYGEFGINSSVFSSGTPSDFYSINSGVYFSGHDGDISIGSGNGFKTYLTWGTVGQSAHVINAAGAIGFSTNLAASVANTGTIGYGTSGALAVTQGSGGPAAWSTNLTWDNTNYRLGIGTASPAYPLDVVGQIRSTDGSVDVRILPVNGSAAATIGTFSASDVVLVAGSGGTQRMRILASNGNVGIGTSSPAYPLDVVGTINGTAVTVAGDPVATQGGKVVTVFTSSGTWTKKSTSTYVQISLVSAGGGGGFGGNAILAGASGSGGGGGGGGGCVVTPILRASVLPSTVTVTVGAGGTGGTTGVPTGGVGGNTSFGTILALSGGSGGAPGAAGAATGGGGGGGVGIGTISAYGLPYTTSVLTSAVGNIGASGPYANSGGSNGNRPGDVGTNSIVGGGAGGGSCSATGGSNFANLSGAYAWGGAGGGGAGGGFNTGAVNWGGYGGGGGGGGGASVASAGIAGTTGGTGTAQIYGAGGGSGGGSSTTTNGFAGGAGGLPGGGGGGGGAALSTFIGGAGGAGGAGIVIVTEW